MENEADWEPHAQRYATLRRLTCQAQDDAEKVHVGVTFTLTPSGRRLIKAAIPPLVILLQIVKVLNFGSLFLLLMMLLMLVLLLDRWIFEICRIVFRESIIHIPYFWFLLYHLIFLITDQFFIWYIIDYSLRGTISIWAIYCRRSCWTIILGRFLTTSSRHGRLLQSISHISIAHSCRWSVLYSQLAGRSWIFWIHSSLFF